MDMANKKTNTAESSEKAVVLTFTKDKIIGSKKYANHRDFLQGNLVDGENYTFEQVDNILKGMVK